jgi:ABC transporter
VRRVIWWQSTPQERAVLLERNSGRHDSNSGWSCPSAQRGGHSEPMRVLHRRRYARGGRRLVLEDVSFDVPPGVCVGIVGPTGAGKTTLLGLSAGSSPMSSRSRSSSRRASPRTSPTAAPGRTRPRSSPPPRQAPTSSSRGSPAGTRPWSASGACCSLAASGSGSRSRARS